MVRPLKPSDRTSSRSSVVIHQREFTAAALTRSSLPASWGTTGASTSSARRHRRRPPPAACAAHRRRHRGSARVHQSNDLERSAVEWGDADAGNGVRRVADARDAPADDRSRPDVRCAYLSMDSGAVFGERGVLDHHAISQRDPRALSVARMVERLKFHVARLTDQAEAEES